MSKKTADVEKIREAVNNAENMLIEEKKYLEFCELLTLKLDLFPKSEIYVEQYEIFKEILSEKYDYLVEVKKAIIDPKEYITTVTKGTFFYRGRKLDSEYCKSIGLNLNIADDSLIEISKVIVTILEEKGYEVGDIYKILHEKQDFKGYNQENFRGFPPSQCGAPPNSSHDKVPGGRLNPPAVPYLYVADDENTAIQETRPIYGEVANIAKFQLKKDVKFLDFTKKCNNSTDLRDYTTKTLYEVLSNAFKYPNYKDNSNYLPTQILTETVKNSTDLDGICYWSALRQGKKNYVLFDTSSSVCDVLSSRFEKIGDMEITLGTFDVPLLPKI